MGILKDLTGTRVGFLVVLEQLKERDVWGAVEWKCKCDCGNEHKLNSGEINRKTVISCSVDCKFRIDHNQKLNFDKKYVRAENGCWIWTAYRDKDGYGNFGVAQKAHRYSYKRFKGVIPEGMLVCHTCDESSCVNPDHLFLGTTKDNHKDMCDKERIAKGEGSGASKLSEKDVKKIRKEYVNGHKSMSELGDEFGISATTACNIINFKTWKHVRY